MLFSFILFSRCHILGLQCSRGTFVACVNSCCSPELFHVSAGHLAIKTITLVDITPIISSKKCSSLRHFSFSGTFAGLPCRPCLPNPSETCQAVFDYISRLGGADSFYLPMKLLPAPLPFNVGPLQEIHMSQRHQVWQRTVTRRYKQKARDRRQQSCDVICACSCTASWFTLSFLTPCTPLTQAGALVLRLRSRRIPSKQG